jgi:hypothetical protein
MTLYNKDGTVYKLDGPNPVMKNQDVWSDFTIHNMNWKSEVQPDKGAKLPRPQKKEVKTQSESFVEELESTKVTKQPDQEQVPKEEERVVESEPIDYDKSVISEEIVKTFIHCLPATTIEKKDSLYGDVSSRVQYNNKTSFEAVILNQTDMSIEMWSEVVFQKGSILYPKNGDKRWWRIQNYYPKLGGHVIQAVPSLEQPYFE